MFKVYKKEIEVAGKKISLETGKVARQADGAIIASCGETVIFSNSSRSKESKSRYGLFSFISKTTKKKYYAGGKNSWWIFLKEKQDQLKVKH